MFESLNNGPETSVDGGACVVICSDRDAVRQIGESLAKCGTGRIVAYDKPSDLAANIPVFDVDMVVFAGEQSPQIMHDMVNWAKRNWRNSVPVVLGNPGQRDLEIATRRAGAFYLTRPTTEYDWDMILEGVRQNRKYCLSQK